MKNRRFSFQDLKIGTRLWLWIGVVSLLLMIVSYISNTSVNHLKEAFEELEEESHEMHMVQEASLAISQVVMPANDYLIVGGDPNEQKNFKSLAARVEEKFDILEPHALNRPDEKQLFLAAKSNYLTLKQKALEIFAFPREEAIGSAMAGHLMEDMDAFSDNAILALNQWHGIAEREIAEATEEFMEAEKAVVFVNTVLICVIIIISLIMAIIFVHSITRPIVSLFKTTQRVASGDLTARSELKTKDEIGILANSFNKMVVDLSKSRDELLSSKVYTDSIISNMVDTLIVVDPKGKIKTVNKATLELLGYKEEELIGKDVSLIFTEEEEEEEEEERLFKGKGLEKLIKEGSVRDLEMMYKTKSGDRIPVSFSGSVMYERQATSDKRRIIGIVGVARDMRQMLNLLQELRNSKEELESYSQSLEIMVEKRTKDLDSSLKEVEESRDVMLSVLEDTEEARKKLELAMEELKQKEEQLIQVGKLSGIGQMAAGVAHEINNPMTSILGFAQLMIARKDIDSSLKEDLMRIEKEGKRCTVIIENLLNFARPQPAQKIELDVNNVIGATIKVVEYSIKREQVELIQKLDPSLPKIIGDPYQLQQVFMNIIINAAHAMPKGGSLTIGSRVTGHGTQNTQVEVSFTDSGCGMSKEIQEKIFEPFFSTAYQRGQKGTGLGLSISYSIVKEHGGRIEVESMLEKGSTFRVILPVKSA